MSEQEGPQSRKCECSAGAKSSYYSNARRPYFVGIVSSSSTFVGNTASELMSLGDGGRISWHSSLWGRILNFPSGRVITEQGCRVGEANGRNVKRKSKSKAKDGLA